jgi:hypothetical protein
MANPRIFVSFAIEDEVTKNLFTGQAKFDKVPYEFTDMSVKKPWDSEWKTNCRSRIKGCDGVIVLITENLIDGEGALWEIKCAKEEKVPIIGVYMKGATFLDDPAELNGIKKIKWTWDGIAAFVNNL